MAKSLGSLIFSVSASTEQFQQQMKRVEDINSKVAEQETRFAEQRLRESDRIASAQKKLDDLRRESGVLEQEAERASIKRKQEIRKELMKIGGQCEKLEDQINALKETSKRNEVERLGALDKLRKAQNAEIARMDRMRALVGRVGSAMRGAFTITTGVVAAATAAYLKLNNELDNLAKRARDVGLSASQLQEFDHQAKLAGLSAGQLDSAVKTFSKNIGLAVMGTGRAKEALAQMGISLTDANGKTKTQSELLRETARYFAENAGAAENAGLAARIFGENGVEVLRVFQSGEDAVNKIFDANGIDNAAAAAERFKDSLEDLRQSVMPSLYKLAGRLSDALVKTFDPDRYYRGLAKGANEILDVSEKTKRELTEIQAEILKTQDLLLKETTKTRLSGFFGATKVEENPAYAKLEETLKTLRARQNELTEAAAKETFERGHQAAALEAQSAHMQKLSDAEKARLSAETDEYKKMYDEVDKIVEAEKERSAQLKEQQSLQARLQTQLKSAQDAQARQKQSRAEFEFETQLQVLRASGREDEAKRLEFAKKRNELMDKYGYSIEEATRAQKTLDELQNKGKLGFSDEAKSKAEEILKRGQGGTIGKRTFEEAQAVAEGRTPEGGFQTSMFKNAAPTSTPFKNINIDTKQMGATAEKQAEAIQNKQAETLGNIEQLMNDLNEIAETIKQTVDGIAVKEGV